LIPINTGVSPVANRIDTGISGPTAGHLARSQVGGRLLEPGFQHEDRQHDGYQKQRRDISPQMTAMIAAWTTLEHTVNQIRLILVSGRRAAFQRKRPSVAYTPTIIMK
jgi:hypothetical protein